MLQGFVSSIIVGLLAFLTGRMMRKIKEKKNERQNIKQEAAIQEHDVKALVKHNPNMRWINYDAVREDLVLHQKWLDGDPEGKPLSLYAESVFDLAGFKGQRIEKAFFSHCLFDHVDLSGTQFVDCEFEYCIFRKCKLDGTDFSSSNMVGTQYE